MELLSFDADKEVVLITSRLAELGTMEKNPLVTYALHKEAIRLLQHLRPYQLFG